MTIGPKTVWVFATVVALSAVVYVVERQLPKWLANKLPLVDSVLIVKSERKLYLLNDNQLVKAYRVSLGRNPVGHKQQEGDARTPEGKYYLDWRNPRSRFYASIHISYPSPADVANATKRGVSAGGEIMIHGRPNWFGWLEPVFQGRDWTDGCVSVSNAEMVEISGSVLNGTPIEIRP